MRTDGVDPSVLFGTIGGGNNASSGGIGTGSNSGNGSGSGQGGGGGSGSSENTHNMTPVDEKYIKYLNLIKVQFLYYNHLF